MMKGYRWVAYVTIILNIFVGRPLKGQLLDSIAPLTCSYDSLKDSPCFLLTITDMNYFRYKPARYLSSIQIADARKPWPPRWFATIPAEVRKQLPYMTAITPVNASVQQGKMIFFTFLNAAPPNLPPRPQMAFVFCDSSLNAVDTFFRYNREIDSHDFRLSANGEKIFFETKDTVLNAKELFGADTFIHIKSDVIKMADANNGELFSWDPLDHLGLHSLFLPYRNIARVISPTQNTFEWSHGNSVCFDFDGNILYSFKHIGIGKISRKDGHIIWRIDRNNLKPNQFSDTIPLYLQHDFNSVKDAAGNIIYTVLSNGDSLHPACEALQFTVRESKSGEPVIKLRKRFKAPESIKQTFAGNYELEQDGSNLLNYGEYSGDTVNGHICFEYKDSTGRLIAQYTVNPSAFYYHVHKMDAGFPPRPEVIEEKGWLTYNGKYSDCTWYQLGGNDKKTVRPVGSGNRLKPEQNGYYCLAVKYGIGYSVSEPIKYTR